MYNGLLSKSFSKHERKRFGYGAFFGCLLIAMSICTVFKPYLGPLPVLNLKVSMAAGFKMLIIRDTSGSSTSPTTLGPITYLSEKNTSNSASPLLEPMAQLADENASIPASPLLEPITPLAEKNMSISTSPVLLEPMTQLAAENNASNSVSPVLEPTTRLVEKNASISASSLLEPMTQLAEKNASTSPSPPLVPTTQLSEMNTSSFPETVKAAETVMERRERPEMEKTEPVTKKTESVIKKVEPLCNFMKPRGDICEIKGDVRVQGKSSSVFLVSSQMSILAGNNNSWSIKPYARKGDQAAMKRVREWSVKSVLGHEEIPQCTKNHSVPAILFSQGGYAGNHFHDFTDLVIPLYLTSRQYSGKVQFLITDKSPLWISKFQAILKKLSRYELIDIDTEEEVHCFPNVIVGLKRNQKELSIDSSEYSYSMRNFREFLRSSYALKKANAIKLRNGLRKRPRLLILSRRRTRAFTNVEEITKMARSLGFKVHVAEASMDVSKFAEVVNSCDVLLGVHGAGLTNLVFLPMNAILIQVVPFGGFEWLATNDFGEPSKDMNLKYLEYKISIEESTLIHEYPPNHTILRDPVSIQKQGWEAFKSVYLDKQNVKIDVNGFRPTLLKALELLHQ
ncbi:beta-1,2-xylosyltransferase XYXT1-like [Juglans microcarpa x Juglans regia]|uniref:beta-1,2-xylosyltransferase XYXT1-like n=1 Tax=Juglans microcarpa x Juglans regia TaxID=2249226 RepID=UPI001B7F4D89|nr:beta-1,2-xylosyltransferase XYXT1-like [Juglans microcarpa x Juglans regia]